VGKALRQQHGVARLQWEQAFVLGAQEHRPTPDEVELRMARLAAETDTERAVQLDPPVIHADQPHSQQQLARGIGFVDIGRKHERSGRMIKH